MSAAYPESVTIEFHNGAAWVNISAYVVGDMRASYGLGGWRPENRVAVLGSLNLTLNNKARLFSPMGGDALKSLNTLSGWTQGARLRVSVTFESIAHVVWIGRILSIDSDDKTWGEERTRVVAVDWMNVPANFPMKRATIDITNDLRGTINLLLARMSVQPESTDLDRGTVTFDAVFDGVQNKTMGISELNRLALSELGYIYMKGDGTLRAEDADQRTGARAPDEIPVAADASGFLLDEASGYILAEDGSRIALDIAPAAAALATDAESFNILLDPNAILNSVMVRAYPVTTDTSAKVLYSLGTPMYIAGRSTLEFSAHYTDPAGGAQISGSSMIAPAANTDYTANTAANGSGSDLTASLAVTATYYGDSVVYSIVLNSDTSGYITKLQARGFGIYYGNSIESTVEDAASQAAYGYGEAQIEQRYERDTVRAVLAARAIVDEYKYPKSRITRMKYLANLNGDHMMAFLNLAIGSLMPLTEDRSAITRHYYITDIAFTIKQGGIINVTYGLKQNESYLSGGLAPLTVEFAGGSADGLDYGHLPRFDDLAGFSVSAWFYCSGEPTGAKLNTILSHRVNTSGWAISEDDTRKIRFDQGYASSQAVWETPGSAFTLNAWHHLTIVKAISQSASAVTFYIDGSAVATTNSVAASGGQKSDIGAHLVLGNYFSGITAGDWIWGFTGKIFDARIYKRQLSAAEAAALYNAGVPSALVGADDATFEAPGINSDLGDDSTLAGTALGASDRLIDNAFRMIGTPHGAPVLRANP